MLLIKIGGGGQINLDYICKDISKLVVCGEKIVIVHGASVARDEIAKKLNIPTKTIISPSGINSVYTDEKAIDVFLMTYAGLINKKIVANLQTHNVNAIGLSGVDGKLWEAKRKDVTYSIEGKKTKLIKNNFTGRVEKINADLIKLLIKHNYVPVICPPAISFDNEIVNTDNDFATAVMVKVLKIKKMIVLFEAPGMLKDFKNIKSLIKNIKKEEVSEYLHYAEGRMKKKLLGTEKAFEFGLKKMYWGDGRIEHPIFNAIEGGGTIIS